MKTAPDCAASRRCILILVAWLDVFTHEPAQNPTVPPSVYDLNLARARLAMQPQPALGGSRAMVTPAAAMDFIHFALSDPKNNYLAKRLGYCANCNLLDAVPKVDGFFSLMPRESDGLISAALQRDQRRLSASWKISWASRKSPRRTNFSTGRRAKLFCRSSPPGKSPFS